MASVCYRFGEFRLKPGTRELSRGGERIALPPKSFECLAYLVECRERAVGRGELISAVWGRAEVSDALLAQTLWRARRVIGDTGREQAALRTVTRFGYQWVAPVTIEREADAVAEGARKTGRKARRVLAACVAVAALVALLGIRLVSLAAHSDDTPGLIVVLPVDLADPKPDDAWLRLGAMEYIAARLRDGARLNVMPSEQVVALALTQHERTADGLRRLAETTGAAEILSPRITGSAGAWTIEIDVYRDGALKSLQANAAVPLAAARIASGRFLEGIGVGDRLAPADGDRLSRIDAAMLAGDLAQARALVASASPIEKRDAALTLRAGRIAFRAGRTDEAERAYRSLDAPGIVASSDERVEAELGLGSVALRRHEPLDAERAYSHALDVLGADGSARLLARAHLERGITYGYLERYEAAMDDYGRARVELERLGDRLGLAGLDTDVAILAADRGRWPDAMAAYDRAIATFDRFGVRDSLVITLANKVGAELAMLDTAASLRDSARAFELGSDLENRQVVDLVATRRIDSLMSSGQLAAAEHLIDRFVDAPDADPDFMLERASLLVEQGRPDEALSLADDILDRIARATPEAICSVTLPNAALVLVDAAALAGQKTRAAELLARASSSHDASGADRRFAFLIAEAKVLALDDAADAAERFAAALALADRDGRPLMIVTAGVAYARFLIAHPDRERAAALVGRLAPYATANYRAAEATAALYAELGDHALAQAAGDRARLLAGERVPLASL